MKTSQIQVEYLDGKIKSFPVAQKTYGEDLLGRVFQDLELLENDYFGLKFKDPEDNLCWIDPGKTLGEQKVAIHSRASLVFGVKFYPVEPGQQLNEELTRYLFVLELRKDLRNGNLNCTDAMRSFFAACLVQSEFGDFDPDDVDCQTTGYISSLNLIPNPSEDILERIRDLHRQRRGQKPFEADFALLEKIKAIETYGAKPVNCKDSHQVDCRLSPSPKGILVFQNMSLVQTWDWNVIRKISFKKKEFLIKLRREDGSPSDIKTFSFKTRNSAKAFWKYSIENHAFFHMKCNPGPKKKPILVSKGSNFRYSGKTQEELKTVVQRNQRSLPQYERKTSIRKPKVPKTDQKQPDGYGDLHGNPNISVPPTVALASSVSEYPSSLSDNIQDIVDHAKTEHQKIELPNGNDLKGVEPDPEPVYDEPRKLRCDYNYSICKEICMTERTHLHDLEVIVCHLRSAVKDESGIPESVLTILYSLFDPVYAFHKDFVSQLEQRVAEWEVEEMKGNRVGTLLADNMRKFAKFESYFNRLESIMREIESALQSYPRFLQAWRSFESRKLCYLPLSSFFIKPISRLYHYYKAIEQMEKREGNLALQELAGPVKNLKPVLVKCLQFQIQSQLQRELIGCQRLVRQGREFIREGYLRKWAGPRGGFNARMFFLFNDCILWTTSKIEPPTMSNVITKPWKLSVELPLNNISVELTDMEKSAPHSFAINLPDPKNANDNKVTSLILSSSTQNQRSKWVSDIELASNRLKQITDPFYSTATGQPSQTYHLNNISPADDDLSQLSESKVKQNTTTQVCWFRYCTLSFEDHLNMSQNVMSGYLMRKFKNKPQATNNVDQAKQSRNWQKLWVVLNNFSIHFYKRHQESAPLAHLPLLEYSVKAIDPETIPNCKHQYVFMIKLKKHEYHFAAETEYFFNRWMETLRTATLSSE